MGFWGEALYENDIALDIRDKIEAAAEDDGIKMIIRETILEIEGMDECEAPIAWLALVDTLFDHGLLTVAVKKKALLFTESLTENTFLSKDTRQRVIEKIQGEQMKRTKPKRAKINDCPWKDGDICLFDIAEKYADEDYFSGWNVGFWKINDFMWTARRKAANVYFFRTKHSGEELKKDPALIHQAQFLPVMALGKRVVMRPALMRDKDYFPEERIHYCGNCSDFPYFPFEWPDQKKEKQYVGLNIFFWEAIEECLLRHQHLVGIVQRMRAEHLSKME